MKYFGVQFPASKKPLNVLGKAIEKANKYYRAAWELVTTLGF